MIKATIMENFDHASHTSDVSSSHRSLNEMSCNHGSNLLSITQQQSLEDAPWDEVPLNSHPILMEQNDRKTESHRTKRKDTCSAPACDEKKGIDLPRGDDKDGGRSKAKAKTKKRSRKIADTTDCTNGHLGNIPQITIADVSLTQRRDSSSTPNSSIDEMMITTFDMLGVLNKDEDPSLLSSSKTLNCPLRENFTRETSLSSFQDLAEALPTGNSRKKSTRKGGIDAKLKRNLQTRPQVHIKDEMISDEKIETAVDVEYNEALLLPFMASSINQVPTIVVACSAENMQDASTDDHSLGSITSTSTAGLASRRFVQRKDSDDDHHDDHYSKRSADVPPAFQVIDCFSRESMVSQGRTPCRKEFDAAGLHIMTLSPETLHSQMSATTSDALKELMPPLKRKTSKVRQVDKKISIVNASDLLKKKILQMNEDLRLKAFSGHSRTSIQSVGSYEALLEEPISLKRRISTTANKYHQTVSGPERLQRQQSPPRRKSIDSSDIKLMRRRMKMKGKDIDGIDSDSMKNKSPRRDLIACEEDDQTLKFPVEVKTGKKVSSINQSINSANMNTTTFREKSTKSTNAAAHTFTESPMEKELLKANSSDEETLIALASSKMKASHAMSTKTMNEASETSGKLHRSTRSPKKAKDEKANAHSQSSQEKKRNHSFSLPDQRDMRQKNEPKVRSRSQSPGRKGKRQPKSLLDPEKLHPWQIRQQLKHRVTPIASVYSRRLDDDDDENDQERTVDLPPAFRHLGQKPKSTRF